MLKHRQFQNKRPQLPAPLPPAVRRQRDSKHSNTSVPTRTPANRSSHSSGLKLSPELSDIAARCVLYELPIRNPNQDTRRSWTSAVAASEDLGTMLTTVAENSLLVFSNLIVLRSGDCVS